jgi:phosphoribosylformylglycinamidine cyclo-ligase
VGDVIVGFASDGQATYETKYNSGIGSNGLTSARHDMLHKTYAAQFPASYDTDLDEKVVYIGSYQLTDPVPANYISGIDNRYGALTIADLLLSPTRTYAPLVKLLLENYFDALHGLIHCSGGGQTKCMKYLPAPFTIIKDNLFDAPPVFNMIQAASLADNREMYQVFNMGSRLEVFTTANYADAIIEVGKKLGIAGKVVGRVEAEGATKKLILKVGEEEIVY